MLLVTARLHGFSPIGIRPYGSARPNTPDCGASTMDPLNEPHAPADFNGFVLLDFASLRLEKWKMVRTVPRGTSSLAVSSTGVPV
jgi:hypothetical protein